MEETWVSTERAVEGSLLPEREQVRGCSPGVALLDLQDIRENISSLAALPGFTDDVWDPVTGS